MDDGTRLTKFDGTNSESWISNAEEFFEFYRTEDSARITIAAFYFDGKARHWYRWMKSNRQLSCWSHFTKAMRERFSNTDLEPPQLYQSRFEIVSNQTRHEEKAAWNQQLLNIADELACIGQRYKCSMPPCSVTYGQIEGAHNANQMLDEMSQSVNDVPTSPIDSDVVGVKCLDDTELKVVFVSENLDTPEVFGEILKSTCVEIGNVGAFDETNVFDQMLQQVGIVTTKDTEVIETEPISESKALLPKLNQSSLFKRYEDSICSFEIYKCLNSYSSKLWFHEHTIIVIEMHHSIAFMAIPRPLESLNFQHNAGLSLTRASVQVKPFDPGILTHLFGNAYKWSGCQFTNISAQNYINLWSPLLNSESSNKLIVVASYPEAKKQFVAKVNSSRVLMATLLKQSLISLVDMFAFLFIQYAALEIIFQFQRESLLSWSWRYLLLYVGSNIILLYIYQIPIEYSGMLKWLAYFIGLYKPIDGNLRKLLILVDVCRALGLVTSNVSFAVFVVSFTHTINALEPIFNAVASQFLLGQSIPFTLWLSLAPVVLGVSMASLTELSFNRVGFISAMISSIFFTYVSLYSKKVMTDMDNTKDFYNLADVYLDDVFFPKCTEDSQTFQQEGWHYELNDPSKDITYKGVVFNEMKCIYSQPDNLLGRTAHQALFPDNTYGVDSGGDPLDILKLTFDEFKEFHCKYYHPSNAKIWFYGDDDPSERLCLLSEYLDMFDASTTRNESKVQPQKLFLKPFRIVEKYLAGEGGDLKKKHMVCLHWLLFDKSLDWQTKLTLGFMDHLLLVHTVLGTLRTRFVSKGMVM